MAFQQRCPLQSGPEEPKCHSRFLSEQAPLGMAESGPSLVHSCRVFFSFLLYFKHKKSMQKPTPSILPFLMAISVQPKFPLHHDPFCTNSPQFLWLCRRSFIVSFALLPSNPHFFKLSWQLSKTVAFLFRSIHSTLPFKNVKIIDMDLVPFYPHNHPER